MGTTQRPTTQRPTTQRPTTQTTAAPQQDNCGTNANNRIVGGTESRQGDWPWAVVLGTKNTFSNRFSVQFNIHTFPRGEIYRFKNSSRRIPQMKTTKLFYSL